MTNLEQIKAIFTACRVWHELMDLTTFFEFVNISVADGLAALKKLKGPVASNPRSHILLTLTSGANWAARSGLLFDKQGKYLGGIVHDVQQGRIAYTPPAGKESEPALAAIRQLNSSGGPTLAPTVKPATEAPVGHLAAGSLNNAIVVITGTFDRGTRSELKALLTSPIFSMQVQSSINGNTEYLLVGHSSSLVKHEQAQERGVSLISQDSLYEYIEQCCPLGSIMEKRARIFAPDIFSCRSGPIPAKPYPDCKATAPTKEDPIAATLDKLLDGIRSLTRPVVKTKPKRKKKSGVS